MITRKNMNKNFEDTDREALLDCIRQRTLVLVNRSNNYNWLVYSRPKINKQLIKTLNSNVVVWDLPNNCGKVKLWFLADKRIKEVTLEDDKFESDIFIIPGVVLSNKITKKKHVLKNIMTDYVG